MAYAGFDRADFPSLDFMARLKSETNLVWCGYYLHAPSQPATTWRGKRAALAAQGWGFAPIYVGQQITGPGSHDVTEAQGARDGADAADQMRAEGFPLGSFVFLDLENGPPFTGAQQGYVGAWIDAVRAHGFGAGVYCSFLFALTVDALRPDVRMWVFRVTTTRPHPVAGRVFPVPEPGVSGFKGAHLWQRDDEARLSGFGDLAIDLNSSLYADPSAPVSPAKIAPPPTPAIPSPAEYPVGSIAWAQQALNTLGARPALDIDGVAGPVTRAAVAKFQASARLRQDGLIGPQTTAALQAALAHPSS